MTTASRTGAADLIDAVAAHGVRYLFGIPGVHTLLPYDLLHDHPTIRPIVTRHEGAAGFAADGYARTTGMPGVCLVVPGPGTTNIATAALVAKSDSVPLVLITAAVPDALHGRYAIHELDLAAFMRPLVKAQVVVRTEIGIADAVTRGFALARAEPPGPVHVLIPYDLFARNSPGGTAYTDGPESEQSPEEPAAMPDGATLETALSLLREAEAPIIYAGYGVVRAGAGGTLVALAEALGAPVVTSNKARGVIPEDHPLAAGIPSMAGVAAVAREADVCLALGTHFNEYTTLTWKMPLPRALIRVDRDPAALAMNYPAAVAVHGDVAVALSWLLERAPERGAAPLVAATAALRRRREEALAAFMASQSDPAPPFHPRYVTRLLRETFPPETIATSDGSATESWLYEPAFTVTRPGSIFVPEVQQTMGYAVGAALGAALGAPDRPVLAVVGDGSLSMTLGELATIAALRIPLTIAVYNDGQYNALRVRQEALFERRFVGTELGALDYARVAQGLGMRGEKIASAAHLRASLRDAVEQRGPLLLDIPITPSPLSERYTAVIESGS